MAMTTLPEIVNFSTHNGELLGITRQWKFVPLARIIPGATQLLGSGLNTSPTTLLEQRLAPTPIKRKRIRASRSKAAQMQQRLRQQSNGGMAPGQQMNEVRA